MVAILKGLPDIRDIVMYDQPRTDSNLTHNELYDVSEEDVIEAREHVQAILEAFDIDSRLDPNNPQDLLEIWEKYKEGMNPAWIHAIDLSDSEMARESERRTKEEEERIREETEDVVYDELNDVEQDEVLRAKYEGQQKVRSRLGQNIINKKGRPDDNRFKLQGFKFKEDVTEKYGRYRGANNAKYSSTPADAQRASIWKRLVNWGQTLTQSKMFSGVGGLPQTRKYLLARYKAFGDMGKC